MILVGYFYINSIKNETDYWKQEAWKNGKYEKISDSLSSYLTKIGNIDSIIKNSQALKDVKDELDKEKAKPKTLITYQTNVYIKDTVHAQTQEDPNDSTYRIANAVDTNGWYELEARYQTSKPYKFDFTKIFLKDNVEIIESVLPNGRTKYFFKNHNPYISINNPEVIVDPKYIFKDNFIEEKSWKWNVGATTNWKSWNTEFFAGIYTPWGIGLIGSFSINNKYYNPIIKEDLKIGIGYLKSF